ncbi:hypothetical protein D3C86_595190 [compost metagenome]
MPGQRPAAHQISVVADAVALDRHRRRRALVFESPTVVQRLAQHERQAVVPTQIGWGLGHAVTRQVRGRRAHDAAVVFGQRQRHQGRVIRGAVADRDVHGLAVQVGQAVADAYLEAHTGILGLEIIQPGQQHVTPQV